jgi:hypothetical protein
MRWLFGQAERYKESFPDTSFVRCAAPHLLTH